MNVTPTNSRNSRDGTTSALVDLTAPISGDVDFDRGRELLRDERTNEALDWFEIAADAAVDATVRTSAALFVTSLLLGSGRPNEAQAWIDRLRAETDAAPGIVDLFDAAIRAQSGEYEATLSILDTASSELADPWFECSDQLVGLIRAHALVCLDRCAEAEPIVRAAFAKDFRSADLWVALATLCAQSDFNPDSILDELIDTAGDDELMRALAWMQAAPPAGVDRIAEYLWQRTGSHGVLAASTSFGGDLAVNRAVEWTVRLMEAGYTKVLPLLVLARDATRDSLDRARAAAIAAAFSEIDARLALEHVGQVVDTDELAAVASDVIDLAPEVADSLLVAAATSTERCLVLASELALRELEEEALSVLVFGLSMDAADELTNNRFAELVPSGRRNQLAAFADGIGDDEVAAILRVIEEPILLPVGDGEA